MSRLISDATETGMEPPRISRAELLKIRGNFLTVVGYFAVSLLLVLFFVARISGVSAEFLGIKTFDAFLKSNGNLFSDAVVEFALLAVAGAFGIFAKIREGNAEPGLN